MPRFDAAFAAGASTLEFETADGAPFYHLALLVPGDRFEAARRWAASRVPLLPGGDLDGVVWDFSNWDALACYFHDPAGTIVELIAHRGLAENGRGGAFEAGELVEVSEIGLVGEPRAVARALAPLQIELCDGTLDEPNQLAFFGERGHVLILSPEGRGWLPTGRPAEPHPVDVTLSGNPASEVSTGSHTIRRTGT